MARPPQYERRLDDVDPDVSTVRNVVKRLPPKDRASLLAWLALYYDDNGEKFGVIKRRRIALDGTEYWMVQIPKPKGTR